jgi:hypothetical protein
MNTSLTQRAQSVSNLRDLLLSLPNLGMKTSFNGGYTSLATA